MSVDAWIVFSLFWVVFVTTPGPNAVNCISNGLAFGFVRALPGVLGILTQATLFMILSALGVTALLVAAPQAFMALKIAGALVLIGLGIRGWLVAGKTVELTEKPASHIYLHALAVATINPKSVAGYLAAFSQFVEPGVPIWTQMQVIVPTALVITAMSYCSYTALGALMGRSALAAVFNVWVRRLLAVCFVIYGILLGFSDLPAG
ncbi:LysE family translocator [Chachezhania antarctica]|uniref:LysE family translocator n=1 Tax=Chachezhania antarctica TaxID=2340860 RepID=UPI000EAEEBB8|nr:LysE family translocator [Chachezhania antarctica]